MLIVYRSRFSFDSILWLAWTLLALLVVVWCVYHEAELSYAPASTKGKSDSFNLDKLFTGPLALKENLRSPLALALEQKLLFLSQSSRPDLKREGKLFSIGIRGSENNQVVKEGEKVFFTLQLHPSGGVDQLAFSQTPTDSFFTASSMGNNLQLHVERANSTPLDLKLSPQPQSKQSGSLTLKTLNEAKWWGQDLLFHQYGGREYKSSGQKERLELSDAKGKYVLWVSPNDFLSFAEGRWQVSKSSSTPLAQVTLSPDGKLQIDAWDENGFAIFHQKFSKELPSVLRTNVDTLLTGAKLRSAKQVSCQLEKKRMLLKVGDWLIQTKSGWHKLTSLRELEEYLNQNLRGELFVIDSIDPKMGLRCHLFDEMRTQMRPVVIPIADGKKKSSKTKKRTPL